jgi:hypothetical protein
VRRLVIAPGPGTWGQPGLYKHLLAAFGPRAVRETREQTRPLGLVWSWTPHQQPHLADLAGVLARAEVSELYVLRAETVPVASWAALRHMAQHAGLRLSLVVQGRPPGPDQLAALRGYRLKRRPAATLVPFSRSGPAGAGAPRWSLPCHQAKGSYGQSAAPALWQQNRYLLP